MGGHGRLLLLLALPAADPRGQRVSVGKLLPWVHHSDISALDTDIPQAFIRSEPKRRWSFLCQELHSAKKSKGEWGKIWVCAGIISKHDYHGLVFPVLAPVQTFGWFLCPDSGLAITPNWQGPVPPTREARLPFYK
ncbi:unnamed protein product [Caretta caretta]